MNAPQQPRFATALAIHDDNHRPHSSEPSSARNSSLPISVPASSVAPTSGSTEREQGHIIGPDSTSKPCSKPDVSVTAPPLVHFRSNTIAPSPLLEQGEFSAPKLDCLSPAGPFLVEQRPSSPGALRISTDLHSPPLFAARRESFNGNGSVSSRNSLNHRASTNSLRPVSRTNSLKQALANSLGSASGTSSLAPSPIISAMGELTPLPSPLLSSDSPGPWKKLVVGSVSPPPSRLRSVGEGSVLVTTSGESIASALSSGPKRKIYANIEPGDDLPSAQNAANKPKTHGRHRSISDYHPDPMGIPKRQVTVSGPHAKIDAPIAEQLEPHMRREINYAESRGLTPTVTKPPTPPPSDSSRDSADGSTKPKSLSYECFEAKGRKDGKRRRWRSLRLLGQGTFSRVMLATTQIEPSEAPEDYSKLDRKTLVAVKVCEHGPRGGASEERVEMSLKRELEIMQTIHHPSLVDLKAWSIEPTRAILVLNYSSGGDLFDVATSHRECLSEPLLRRLFAEIVGAVSYLHERRIVHRDIKLENVLVNLTPEELADSSVDWANYPYSITTLTDLGLSRRIADDEKLETRCGSEDYAAPEVIMGQPYDGRACDAWSMGVLLYALLESRLPFDPHPSMSDAHRMRSRTSHRIARVEWRWVEFAGDDTDHDGSEAKFQEKGLLGAMEITEGLLKRARSRWTLDKVSKTEWVQGGITTERGLRFREEHDGQEVQ